LVVIIAHGIEAVSSAHWTPAGALDLNQTLKMIEAERDPLQGIYDALPAARKKTLVARADRRSRHRSILPIHLKQKLLTKWWPLHSASLDTSTNWPEPGRASSANAQHVGI
jgi:hypothetical protein